MGTQTKVPKAPDDVVGHWPRNAGQQSGCDAQWARGKLNQNLCLFDKKNQRGQSFQPNKKVTQFIYELEP